MTASSSLSSGSYTLYVSLSFFSFCVYDLTRGGTSIPFFFLSSSCITIERLFSPVSVFFFFGGSEGRLCGLLLDSEGIALLVLGIGAAGTVVAAGAEAGDDKEGPSVGGAGGFDIFLTFVLLLLLVLGTGALAVVS
jgi:hypothetical protein